MRSARPLWILPLLLCLGSTVGCGDEFLDPSVVGSIDAGVVDDHYMAGPSDSTPVSDVAAYEGTVAGNMWVAIRGTDGTWVELGSPNGITLDLQNAAGSTVHGPTTVPAGRYNRVRLTLSRVVLTVQSGGMVEQTTLQAHRTVHIGNATPLVIEKSVETFTVEESGSAHVVLDLNTEYWLNMETLHEGTASAATVRVNTTAVSATD